MVSACAFLSACAAQSADPIEGHWAITERECQSDGSFIIADGQIHGEGGARTLHRSGDALRTDDGLIDVDRVHADATRLAWRNRETGEAGEYVRCVDTPAPQ